MGLAALKSMSFWSLQFGPISLHVALLSIFKIDSVASSLLPDLLPPSPMTTLGPSGYSRNFSPSQDPELNPICPVTEHNHRVQVQKD